MTKAERFTRKYFGIPISWDKHDKTQIRYSFNRVEDAAEQFSDNQLTEYHNRLKEVLETTGQLREEDLGYCLGLVSEYALDQVKQKESNDET